MFVYPSGGRLTVRLGISAPLGRRGCQDIGFVVLAKNADGWHRLSSGWGGPPNAYALAGYGIPQEFANDLWQEFMRSRNHFYSVF